MLCGCVQINSNKRKVTEYMISPGYIVFDAQRWMSMIPVRRQGFNGQGVDRVWADQGFDIFGITVSRIFRARACPQQPLCARALFCKFSKMVTAKEFFVELVRYFRAGNRDLSM